MYEKIDDAIRTMLNFNISVQIDLFHFCFGAALSDSKLCMIQADAMYAHCSITVVDCHHSPESNYEGG